VGDALPAGRSCGPVWRNGRRGALKMLCRKTCGFESHHRYWAGPRSTGDVAERSFVVGPSLSRIDATVILRAVAAGRRIPRHPRSARRHGANGVASSSLGRQASAETGGPRCGWRGRLPARRPRSTPATRPAPRAARFPTPASTNGDTGGTTCPHMSPEERTEGVRQRNAWSVCDQQEWAKHDRPRAGQPITALSGRNHPWLWGHCSGHGECSSRRSGGGPSVRSEKAVRDIAYPGDRAVQTVERAGRCRTSC
jgi:hypothetical protein